MSDVNPYAAPEGWNPADSEAGVVRAELVDNRRGNIGIWRKGRILIMHRHARLPDRCVKTNQPTTADQRWQNTYTWCHWVVWVSVLAGLLVALILYMILSKKATIDMGLTRPWIVRRRWAYIVGWLLVLMSFVGGCVTLVLAGDPFSSSPWTPWLGWGSLGLFIFGLAWMVIRSRIVVPSFMDNEYVWLKGVHPDYLAALPEWPGR